MESLKQWNKVCTIQYNLMASPRYHNSCLDILVRPFCASWAFKPSPSAQCGICANKVSVLFYFNLNSDTKMVFFDKAPAGLPVCQMV